MKKSKQIIGAFLKKSKEINGFFVGWVFFSGRNMEWPGYLTQAAGPFAICI